MDSRERQLLKDEITLNLARLNDFWVRVRPDRPEDEIHWVNKVVYARRFVDEPRPAFATRIYERHQGNLERVLTGRERGVVARLYVDLAAIGEAHARLYRALQSDLARLDPANRAPGEVAPLTHEAFLREAGSVWTEVWHRIERVLAEGNPI